MNKLQDDEVVTVIKRTMDYEKFIFLIPNRPRYRAHINNLKAAMQQFPQIFAAQPVLVNEKWEIIDGQHRFVGAMELGRPIYYIQVSGLTMEIARAMNILQLPWQPMDFARSYANSKKSAYVTYLAFRDKYPFTHSTILHFLVGSRQHGIHAKFRRGEFEVTDAEAAQQNLDRLLEVREVIRIPMLAPFAIALLYAFKTEGFKYDHFMNKLKMHGDEYLRRTTSVADCLRMIEDIYNYQLSDKNRLRIF